MFCTKAIDRAMLMNVPFSVTCLWHQKKEMLAMTQLLVFHGRDIVHECCLLSHYSSDSEWTRNSQLMAFGTSSGCVV